MTYNFTTKDVLNEVIRLSEEDPDFVYTTQPGRGNGIKCGYTGITPGTTEGRPCIVGQALQNLGVPKDDLIHLDNIASFVLEKNLHIKSDNSTDVLNTLDGIQQYQDWGLSWGESVSKSINKEDYA